MRDEWFHYWCKFPFYMFLPYYTLRLELPSKLITDLSIHKQLVIELDQYRLVVVVEYNKVIANEYSLYS